MKRFAWILAVLAVVPAAVVAGVRETNEASRIKAGIVFNLSKVVTWPAGAVSVDTFVLEVVGADARGPDFAVLGDKQVRGIPLEVRFARQETLPPGPILFISESEADRLDAVLAEVAGRPVLTVSQIEGFCERGGMIQIYEQRNKIRMRINRRAAQAAGLTLSSQLLRVAELVGEED